MWSHQDYWHLNRLGDILYLHGYRNIFAIIWLFSLCPHLQIVTKFYPPTSKRKELVNFYFEFDTNKAEISLVPEDSISSEENWTQKSDEVHIAVLTLTF